ncbi:MAG: PSD1 and planctomycete cytochrome C domain-containing protein [Pirellula sp.]|nr:PSD1 and planctomycete cytochrome C domain-containing protein [Pirellula sp.]
MPPPFLRHASLVLACLFVCLNVPGYCQEASHAESNRFFETHIRPLLEEHCIECHSGNDPSAGIDLSSRSGWTESGAIKPGDSRGSLLLQVILSEDLELRMPPPPKDPLKQKEIETLRQWIDRGAFDPRESKNGANEEKTSGPKRRNRVFEITDEDRTYWAFQPIMPPVFAPELSAISPSAKIDYLVVKAAGNQTELRPAAAPRTLIRRLYLDLWGIPPTMEQVSQFEQNPSSENWLNTINSLLNSHHYGERWGRYWLDWVRFGETNGYERDGIKENAWRYRDYVIDALERDKPYDQFILEQLAGDEWAEEQGWSRDHNSRAWRDAIIATGFYRLHVWDDEPDDTVTAEFDEADDVMVSVGSAFLGLTVGCARCHDHKFDPISQKDYYSMLSFLRGIEPYGLNKKGGGGRGTGRIQRPLGIENESALAVWETGPLPKETHVLHRGDPNSPRELVSPEIPLVLQTQVSMDSAAQPTAQSSGRRLQFAKWLTDPRHPLTARVIANRIWQRHFGTGLVPTIDDFGKTGLPVTNPELLDFLATELIQSGWSLKHLHRIILLSNTYQQSAHSSSSKEKSTLGPELQRLDSEAIRDSILFVTGKLGTKDSGPSVYPRLSQEVKDSANPVSLSVWQESPFEEQNCRSVYLIVKRSLQVPFLEVLDFPSGTAPSAIRNVTTTAPQALLLLNDPWMEEQSKALLDRVSIDETINADARIKTLWNIVYQRNPSADEVRDTLAFLRVTEELGPNAEPSVSIKESGRWVSLCRVLLSSSEFLYRD